MKLSDWMLATKTTDSALAKKVERDRTTVLRWRTGQTKPDWDALKAIHKATGRRVTPNDFLEAAR